MRIAWIGPPPRDDGGVPEAERLFLEGASACDVDVDFFCVAEEGTVLDRIEQLRNITLRCRRGRWKWDRWYSRGKIRILLTRQPLTALSQYALAHAVAESHDARPYDLVYQFSTYELLGLRRLKAHLPPIVLHPQVHAAGELSWLRRESAWARPLEGLSLRTSAVAALTLRQRIQRRDTQIADLIVTPSQGFARLIERDYGRPRIGFSVVPNPVDLERFRPPPAACPRAGILVPSYLAARKGLEMVVALSWRMSGTGVRMTVVGEPRQWSDYSGLMSQLNPETAAFEGWANRQRLAELYRHATAVLVPSHYEPFGLTVAEALASGTPVIASDQVGATEDLDGNCFREFNAGDINDLERCVRSERVLPPDAQRSRLCRQESERLFGLPSVSRRWHRALQQVVRCHRGTTDGNA